MYENEKSRILNMLKDGKITVDEAAKLLDALGGKEGAEENAEPIELKDRRGRKPKMFRMLLDKADNQDTARVNLNIPISLIRSVGPLIARNMSQSARDKLNEKGIDLSAIFSDIDKFLQDGLANEDIVNIDTGDGSEKYRVRIYVE